MAIIDVYKKKDPYSYDSVKTAKAEMDKYNTYTQSDSVLEKYNLANENQNKLQSHQDSWDTDLMSKAKLEAYDAWKNRADFSYDVNGDALYQQYKDQYINQGRLAMMDTMGQAATMTGGYGNSYAATVGNQAYQGYLQKLNEVVPELYNMAYNMYQQEGEDLKYAYDVARDDYNTKYGEWSDKLGFLQSEQNRLDSNYYNEANLDRSMWESDRTHTTGLYNTALELATNNENTLYNDSFNKATWEKEYLLSERTADQSDTIASLKEQIGSLEDELEAYKGTDYSGWSKNQWIEYFTELKRTHGKAAAEEQLSKLATSGDLPTEHVAAAAVVVRGSLGH